MPVGKFFKWRRQKPEKGQLRENIKRMLSKGRAWSTLPEIKHSFVPTDAKLIEKLGFMPGQRIHFFAGFVGGWASELARQGLRVTFTDISRKRVREAREAMLKEHLYEKALSKEAGRYPRKPLQYDWNFSFEPFPVLRDNPVAPILRGLLNRYGYKIAVYGPGWHNVITSYANSKMLHVCRLYGAELEISFVDIVGIPHDAKKARAAKHLIVTIRTNDEARRKAWLDLLIIKRVRFLKSQKRPADAEALKADEWLNRRFASLGIAEKERSKQIEESLARLDALKKIDPLIFMR